MKGKTLGLCLLILFTFGPGVRNASAEWNYTFIPTLSLGLEYDANIFFTPSNEENDFNYNANVTFPFRAESEATQVGLNYRTSYFQYNSTSNANYGNHYINLDASHQFTRRLGFALRDGFSLTKDSDRILRSGSFEGESGIVVDRVRRKANSATASMSYSLSPKASFSLSATDSFYRYSLPQYYDSSSNGGTVSYNYSLDPRNTVFISASGSRSDYERNERELTENATYRQVGFNLVGFNLFPVYELLLNNEFEASDNYSAFLGLRHRFSSTLNVTLSGGTRWTKETLRVLTLAPGTDTLTFPNPLPLGDIIQFTPAGSGTLLTASDGSGFLTLPSLSISTADASMRNSGLVYNVSVDKTFRASSLSLNFSQNTNDRVALGGTTVRQSYRASYTQRLSDLFSAYVNGNYDKNKTDSEFRSDRYKTFRVGAGCRYTITRDLRGALSWNHTEQTRDLQGAFTQPRTSRDLISLVFTYQWHLLE